PSFLPSVPLMKPRMLCGCHSVARINSWRVAPPGRFSSSITWEVLLPWRAVDLCDFLALLIAFLAGVACFPALPFAGAPFALCAPPQAFFVAFGCVGALRVLSCT